ncbi:UDP-glucose 4-epimerase GalE [Pseudomonas sp. P8_241]|uniref:UDP-glucose 4-epimerase GalE n=1 Tax=Pseudomonas sp. P8_241 TaxID=3043445 RepID=UPI002A35B56D|nr:UDP-glucose 4-epimerase GalE [Pseudomonas sp. P8_241]WPN45652.1 UDP-glucose 4-epimerase GalE [Pseudomonas sp. P8_241]
MNVLVTGGAGYIGSHTALALLEAGHSVTVLDNLTNSSTVALQRVEALSGRPVNFVNGDILDSTLLDTIFSSQSIDAVLHFAGLKAVGESAAEPLTYFINNVTGSLTLCNAMKKANVFNLVFSSSATVYGEPTSMPISEDFETGAPTNPYGRSKLMVEECLKDIAASDSRWCIALLRYFNPVGAHSSGMIGENPSGLPNNLLPFISKVAAGKLKELCVFGDDYPTVDGTGMRDYIHVVDLADGHLKALNRIVKSPGVSVWNLGRGEGYTVLQMISAFENATGCKIPYRVVARRSGDIAECWADTYKAQVELGWTALRTVEDMMIDTWRWIRKNPDGYKN